MRKTAALISALAVLAVLAGCGRSDSFRPDTLVIGLEGNPTALDPRLAQDAYSTRIVPLLFEGLFELDENAEPQPLLVTQWYQPDDLTFIFILAPGHRDPAGREIGAADVVYTLASLADPALRSPRSALFGRIEDLAALDDRTLFIRLKEPYAPILTDLTVGIVPRAVAAAPDFRAAPAGSGPYQVTRWEPGAEVALTPNPHWHGAAVAIPNLVFRVLPDDVTRTLALERGEVQLLLSNLPPDDVPEVEKNPGLRVIQQPGINYSYLGFNLRDPLLSDPRVRRAIALAIDRAKIADCLLKGTVTLADSLLAPGNWARAAVATPPYDPAAAAALLDAAGHPDPDGPGPLPRFKLSYKTSTNKQRRWIADAIADQLRAVGIEVEVRSYEWWVFFSDIVAGNFQIYSLTWVGITDPDIFYLAFNSDSFPPKGANRNRYANPEVDRLTALGRRTLDRDGRRAAYQQVHRPRPALRQPVVRQRHRGHGPAASGLQVLSRRRLPFAGADKMGEGIRVRGFLG